ncbi:DnaJ domain-containing protein [Campylobacter corcagiensis]|uniref:DnaJ domain-containing protein n=1 Tax=Campylobacter corcagiensis TaxID=1448857 RepID=A0A7M1LIP4_9BACT|nr:DnaJ domain-containing protein [Campylobacter corcagiensis]
MPVIFFAIFLFYYLSKGIKFSSPLKRAEEARYIVALLAKVVKSDGRVNETEAAIVSEVLSEISMKFRVDRDELKRVYNSQKDNTKNAFGVAFEYNQRFKLSTPEKIGKIYFFLNLAYMDGNFNDAEKRIISEICDGFELYRGLKEEIFSKFGAEFRTRQSYNQNYSNQNHNNQNRQKSSKKTPYEILGVDRNISNDELKKVYRSLVKKYHPDILMGRGADDEIVEAGTKKLQEINEAYEKIKNERGL